MKVALISPSPEHLQQLGSVLHTCAHQSVLVEGGKSKMREVVECERPDIVIVEGMCCDPAELTQVEYLSAHHPNVAVVLLCASASPEFLINSMRAGVREVLPCPVSAIALQSALERIVTRMRISQGKADGRVFAFIGCKGGAGATFLATNLAAELATRRSVLLMDLNLQFGDALSFLHDGAPASTLADVAREIGRLDASFLASSATRLGPRLSILAAPEDPAQSMEIKPDHIEAVVSLAAANYDFVLMDVGRTIDGTSVKALDRADKIFIVMQPSVPGVRNAKKLLLAFRALGYGNERVELIVNRFERADIGVADIERALGKLTIHTVPNSYRQVTAAINQGDPLALAARSNPVSRNLADFARGLTEEPLAKSPGLFGRLLGRAA
ncbi:AAA family ATPase [Massilia solisilvae]|uniref:AAA family ATPase n=1 Tax=Massilia solisilvae TaxID=1811225 RepID=A0ABT2BLX5_9BURK|nr:AAA family ATPase [Massilia solisilvae]MCS0609494.1 AAA family ATPase [Massilia solisilvae]